MDVHGEMGTATDTLRGPAGKGRLPRGLMASIALMVLMVLPLPRWLVPGLGLDAQVGREIVYWLMAAAILLFVRFIERRPLISIGLAPVGWKSLLFGILGGMITVAGMAFIYLVIYPALGMSSNESQLTDIQALPAWFRIMLVARAGVFEEILYRGFMIERLNEALKWRWLAALISFAAFTLAHLDYWGWAHLLIAGFGGAVLTLLYLWRRDLGCNMFAHIFTDAVGFLAG